METARQQAVSLNHGAFLTLIPEPVRSFSKTKAWIQKLQHRVMAKSRTALVDGSISADKPAGGGSWGPGSRPLKHPSDTVSGTASDMCAPPCPGASQLENPEPGPFGSRDRTAEGAHHDQTTSSTPSTPTLCNELPGIPSPAGAGPPASAPAGPDSRPGVARGLDDHLDETAAQGDVDTQAAHSALSVRQDGTPDILERSEEAAPVFLIQLGSIPLRQYIDSFIVSIFCGRSLAGDLVVNLVIEPLDILSCFLHPQCVREGESPAIKRGHVKDALLDGLSPALGHPRSSDVDFSASQGIHSRPTDRGNGGRSHVGRGNRKTTRSANNAARHRLGRGSRGGNGRDDQDDQDDQDEPGGAVPGDGEGEVDLCPGLACPFSKKRSRLFPQPICASPRGWDGMARLRQHILRNHGDVITQEMLEGLKQREDREAKWRRLYRFIHGASEEEAKKVDPYYVDMPTPASIRWFKRMIETNSNWILQKNLEVEASEQEVFGICRDYIALMEAWLMGSEDQEVDVVMSSDLPPRPCPQDAQPAAHDPGVLPHQGTASGHYWQQEVHQDQAIVPAGLLAWAPQSTLQVQSQVLQEQHPTGEGGPNLPPQSLFSEYSGVSATYESVCPGEYLHAGSELDSASGRGGWPNTEAQNASTQPTSVTSDQIHPELLLSPRYQNFAPGQICEPHESEWYEGVQDAQPVKGDGHYGGDSSAGSQRNFNSSGGDSFFSDYNLPN